MAILGAVTAVLTVVAGRGYENYTAQQAIVTRSGVNGTVYASVLTMAAVPNAIIANYTDMLAVHLDAENRMGIVQIAREALIILACIGLLTAASAAALSLARFKTLFHLAAGTGCFASLFLLFRWTLRLIL